VVLSAITSVQRMTCDITHACYGETIRAATCIRMLACAASIRWMSRIKRRFCERYHERAVHAYQCGSAIRAGPGISNSDHIYVALTISISPTPHRDGGRICDGGATYKSFPSNSKTAGQDVLGSPASQVTIRSTQLSLAAKIQCTVATSDIVVVRDDAEHCPFHSKR